MKYLLILLLIVFLWVGLYIARSDWLGENICQKVKTDLHQSFEQIPTLWSNQWLYKQTSRSYKNWLEVTVTIQKPLEYSIDN